MDTAEPKRETPRTDNDDPTRKKRLIAKELANGIKSSIDTVEASCV
jgi:hypothetical protein